MLEVMNRLNRSTFSLGYLIINVLFLPIALLPEERAKAAENNSLAALALLGFVLVAGYYLFRFRIRRLHDLNMSGWLSLLCIIPGVDLVLIVLPGTLGNNRFGAAHHKRWDFNALF